MGNSRVSVLSRTQLSGVSAVLDEGLRFFQVEDGTIFYVRHDINMTFDNLFVLWHGKSIEAKLPVERAKCSHIVAHGKKIFIEIQNKIYSAVFNPPHGIQFSQIRSGKEGEEFHDGGICIRVRDGVKYYSRICDDANSDGIEIMNISTFVNVIHRGRAVYCDTNNDKGEPTTTMAPFVRSSNESGIVIEIASKRMFFMVNALDSTPYVYIVQDRVAHILNTENMEFTPEFSLRSDYISQIVGIHDGVIALATWDETLGAVFTHQTYYLMQVQIPEITETEGLQREFDSEFLTKFEPRKVLGKGNFGCVFEAQHYRDKMVYAVKRIAVKGSDADVTKAFEEVCTLASLDHNGIVNYKTSWLERPPEGWQKRTDEQLLKMCKHEEPLNNYKDDCVFIYIQMELCRETLHDWLYSTPERDLIQAKVWFKQLVSAVGFLHKENKIHRDLKATTKFHSWKKFYIQPLNILFDSNGRLKICDLGIIADIVLENGREIDKTRTNIGTPMYMAPEQNFWSYSSKVDIFSLGLILIELCVCMSMERAREVFLHYQRGRHSDVLKDLPDVDRFVSWLTNRTPSERPNCEEILAHEFLA